MTTNDNEMNEFKDIESTLKKAFAREKQQGLAPHQLRALHEAIEGENVRAKPRKRWWQWSMAGSLVAAALVAVVVADRFPGSTDVMTETSAPLAKEKTAQKDDKATAQPVPMALADGRGAVNTAPAESTPGQGPARTASSVRRRESARVNGMAGSVAKPKPEPRPKILAKPSAPPASAGPKGEWETKSQLAESAEMAADAESAPAAFGSGAGGNSQIGMGAGKSPGGSKKSLGLAQETAKPAPRKKSRAAAEIGIASTAFKGKGSAASVKAVLHANLSGLKTCYAALLERNPNAKGSMNLVWQIPNFKLRMSADIFADTKMRACVQDAMAGWTYPAGTVGNAEATLRFGYGR